MPVLYPLELNDNFHILLHHPDDVNNYYTIAYFKDGNLLFVGDRPLDPHVNWVHFRKLVEFGYSVLNERYENDD